MLGRKKRRLTEGPKALPRPQKVTYPVMVLFRMFVLGAVAVVASGYALWRAHTVPRVPMLEPVRPAPSEIEIEVAP